MTTQPVIEIPAPDDLDEQTRATYEAIFEAGARDGLGYWRRYELWADRQAQDPDDNTPSPKIRNPYRKG